MDEMFDKQHLSLVAFDLRNGTPVLINDWNQKGESTSVYLDSWLKIDTFGTYFNAVTGYDFHALTTFLVNIVMVLLYHM